MVRARLLGSSGRDERNDRGRQWLRTHRQLGYVLPPLFRPLVPELLLANGAPPLAIALGPRLTDSRRVGRLQEVCARRLRRLGGLPAEAESAAERAFLTRTLATIDPVHEPVLRRVSLPANVALPDVLELNRERVEADRPRPGIAA